MTVPTQDVEDTVSVAPQFLDGRTGEVVRHFAPPPAGLLDSVTTTTTMLSWAVQDVEETRAISSSFLDSRRRLAASGRHLAPPPVGRRMSSRGEDLEETTDLQLPMVSLRPPAA